MRANIIKLKGETIRVPKGVIYSATTVVIRKTPSLNIEVVNAIVLR